MSLVGIKIDGLVSFEQALDNYGDKVKQSTLERASIAAYSIQGKALRRIQNQSFGKTVKGRTVSAPGQAPNTDTGSLVSSIRVKFSKSEVSAFVFTKLIYAAALEFGTVHMLPRPFLQPSFDEYVEEMSRKNWKI